MSKRRRFRELLAEKSLTLVPGAYDALSARIIEAQGFDAVVAGGYAGIGSTMGAPDIGQSNLRDYADHYGRIAQSVSIPLFVDGDTGFGGVNNVRELVRAFEAAGVAALFFSDQVFPNRCGYLPGKKIEPAEQMIAKLKAALDARQDPDLVICARTDATAVHGLDAAIERGQMFMEVGADVAMIQGADTLEEVARVGREVPGPRFATVSQAAGRRKVSLDALEEIGVTAVFFPSATLFAAVKAVTHVMGRLKRERSLDGVLDDFVPLEEYYDLVGLPKYHAAEQRYDDEAKALVAKYAAKRG